MGQCLTRDKFLFKDIVILLTCNILAQPSHASRVITGRPSCRLFTHMCRLFSHICRLFTHICRLFTHICRLFSHICRLFTHICILFTHICRLFTHICRLFTHSCRLFTYSCRLFTHMCRHNSVILSFCILLSTSLRLPLTPKNHIALFLKSHCVPCCWYFLFCFLVQHLSLGTFSPGYRVCAIYRLSQTSSSDVLSCM